MWIRTARRSGLLGLRSRLHREVGASIRVGQVKPRMRVAATVLLLFALAANADAAGNRCRRAQYPYLHLQIYACSRLRQKPPVIVLDPANYTRLRAEMEQCVGHRVSGQLKLCGIPVVPGSKPPKGIST
jgi:hypothetical protein